MTTPIENILPYGVSWIPEVGSPTVTAATAHPKVVGRNLRVDPGPVLATLTWNGAEACSLYLSRAGQLTELAVIPVKSGGGIRPAKCVRFGALAGDSLYLFLRPAYAGGAGAPTGTIEVIPTYSG